MNCPCLSKESNGVGLVLGILESDLVTISGSTENIADLGI